MKIGHIFDAITINNPLPSNVIDELMNSLVYLRYGAALVGFHDNPTRLGAAVLKSDDFFRIGSGLVDSHHIVFDLDEIRSKYDGGSAPQLLEHLQWMVDSRRNPNTIRLIMAALNEALAKADIEAIDLPRLARDLEAGLADADEKALTQSLLTGKVSTIEDESEKLSQASKPVPVRRVREMLVVWALLDLQIIASKLFHAEWNALETGGENPDLVNIATIRDILEKFRDHAREVAKAFRTGRHDPKLARSTRWFLRKYGLEAHAVRNGLSMGFTLDELRSSQPPKSKRRQLGRFLDAVEKEAERIYQKFEPVDPSDTHYTVEDSAKLHGQSVKVKMGAPQSQTPTQIQAKERHRTRASSNRYSMSALVALIYGVRRVVEAIASIPADDRVSQFTGVPRPETGLLSQDAQSKLVEQLVPIYRHLFTRDANSSGDKRGNDLDTIGPAHWYEPGERPVPLVPESETKPLGALAAHFGADRSPETILDEARHRAHPYKAYKTADAIEQLLRAGSRLPNAVETSKGYVCPHCPDDAPCPHQHHLNKADLMELHFDSSLKWRLTQNTYAEIY